MYHRCSIAVTGNDHMTHVICAMFTYHVFNRLLTCHVLRVISGGDYRDSMPALFVVITFEI